MSWRIDAPLTVAESVHDDPTYEWRLVLKGADPSRTDRLRPSVEYLRGYLADATSRNATPALHNESPFPFIELLDAFRFCGFSIAHSASKPIAVAFRDQISGLPAAAHEAAEDVATSLRNPTRLQEAILFLGSALDSAGEFQAAATAHLIGYELALQRSDGVAGIDAARSAGRSFRRMGELEGSLRWYRLAARIAAFEQDLGRLALALDGTGNTHRHQGSFPRARTTYQVAWRYATLSKDETAIGNVAHSLALVERWAGDLAAASIHAWTALTRCQDSDARARGLINLGSILREGHDLENAEIAFSLARRASREPGYRALATDALAYCAALRGDQEAYGRWRTEVRDARIREPFLRAQIGYFRGLSLAALGRTRRARRVLAAVERYSREWGLAQWEIKAAEPEKLPLPQDSPMATPPEVRQGLRALQGALI